jgi:hypothetical protein
MRYLAILAVVLFVSACKKDPRMTVYQMDTYNNSGITGTVTFIEQVGKDAITVRLQADGMVKDSVYLTHLHEGTPGNLTDTHIYFDDIRTSTGSIRRDETWNKPYDEAIKSNTCFTMHRLEFFSNDTVGYVLSGGTGANGGHHVH